MRVFLFLTFFGKKRILNFFKLYYQAEADTICFLFSSLSLLALCSNLVAGQGQKHDFRDLQLGELLNCVKVSDLHGGIGIK